MKMLTDDIKFSLRLLKKAPLFSSICLVVVTLGLAVAICNYSLLYEFTKAPPYPDGERFFGVKVFSTTTGDQISTQYFNANAYHQIIDNVPEFEIAGGYDWVLGSLLIDGVAHRFNVIGITSSILSQTGVKPVLGRLITEQDLRGGTEPVAIISYSLWQNQFGGRNDVIGTSILIDGEFHTVVGVMPENYFFPFAQDVWRPITIPRNRAADESQSYSIVGKLNKGQSFDEATLSINRTISNLAIVAPQIFTEVEARVVPISSMKSQGAVGIRELLRALTVVVFLLASLNLSTLLFARARERTGELAVRNAVGASVWQLRKQVLLESGLLCLAGGFLALGLAEILLRSAQLVLNEMLQSLDVIIDLNLRIHAPALVYALIVMLLIWITSSAITVYRVTGKSLHNSFDKVSKTSTSRAANRTMRAVVGTEVILSCFLLIVCGLLTYSIVNAHRVDFGVDTKNRYFGEFSLSSAKYQDLKAQQIFFDRLKLELQNEAMVESISFTDASIGGWNWPGTYPYALPDRDLTRNGTHPEVLTGLIGENYFQSLNVELLEGRYFNQQDNENSQQVVIVDELLAANLWPNQSALGKQLQLNPDDNGPLLEIVGVNRHLIHGQPTGQSLTNPAIYRPLRQQATPTQRLYVMIHLRNQVSTSALSQSIRLVMAKTDSEVALGDLVALDEFLPMGLQTFNFIGQIVSWFTFVTLLLSAIGVYGIIARSVSLRVKEIGIRQALGSTKARITRIFLRQGFIYLVLGVSLGGSAAILLSNVLTVMFPDILDGLVMVSMMVLVTVGALVLSASYLPTREVVKAEPGESLRTE